MTSEWVRPTPKRRANEPSFIDERVIVDASVIDGDDPAAVIHPVWWTGNIYDGIRAYEDSLKSFSAAQRRCFAVQWYRSQVSNGGHFQFYANSTGIVWLDALDGFGMLELPAFASILRESADRLGGSPPLDRTARNALLGSIDVDMADLDTRFYNLDGTGELRDCMLSYMRSHVSEFTFDGIVRKPRL